MFLLIRSNNCNSCGMFSTLHSNMFLLIPGWTWKPCIFCITLHSNMFLLIRVTNEVSTSNVSPFTFQYVSINTCYHSEKVPELPALHSNMFLLIQSMTLWTESFRRSLHSNMFLLIRRWIVRYNVGRHLYIPICFY